MVAESVFVTGAFDTYCTVDDVYRLMSGYDLTPLGTTDEVEAHIRDLLTPSRVALDAEAGRDFLFHADDEVICDGTETDRLALSVLGVTPLITVACVWVDDKQLAATEYVVYASAGIVRLKPGSSVGGSFPAGVQNVKVQLDWGYETAPGEISLAQAKLIGAQLAAELAGDRGSIQHLSLGDYAVTYDAGGEHARVIERWVEDARRAARMHRSVRLAVV